MIIFKILLLIQIFKNKTSEGFRGLGNLNEVQCDVTLMFWSDQTPLKCLNSDTLSSDTHSLSLLPGNSKKLQLHWTSSELFILMNNDV